MNSYYLYCPSKLHTQLEAENQILGMFVNLQKIRYVGVNKNREHVFFIQTPINMVTEINFWFNNTKKGTSYLYISKKYEA